MATVRIDPPIVVDELTIREYRMDDLVALDEAIVRNRERLLPWVGDWIKSEPIGLAARREVLRSWIDSYPTVGGPVGAFIGDELVAGVGLYDRNGPADTEVGYWVDVRYEGRGIATRAAGALTDLALRQPDIDRVLLIHHPDNAKSRRVPEKLGFVLLSDGVPTAAPGMLVWAKTRES